MKHYGVFNSYKELNKVFKDLIIELPVKFFDNVKDKIIKIDDYEKKYDLKENEYFLKVVFQNIEKDDKIYAVALGYPDKTKLGKIPVTMKNWRGLDKKIVIFKDDFLSGYKIIGERHGKSQCWIRIMHPTGFIFEISNKNFIDIIEYIEIKNGEIITPIIIDVNDKSLKLRVKG
jgi:hypothetical protein